MAKSVKYNVKDRSIDNVEELSSHLDPIQILQNKILTALSKTDRHDFFDTIQIKLVSNSDLNDQKSMRVKIEFNRYTLTSQPNIYAELDIKITRDDYYGLTLKINNIQTRPRGASIAPHILNIIPTIEAALDDDNSPFTLKTITLRATLSHGAYFWGYLGFKPRRGELDTFCGMAEFMNDQRFLKNSTEYQENQQAIQNLRQTKSTKAFWDFLDNKTISYPLIGKVDDISRNLWQKDAELGTHKYNPNDNGHTSWGYDAILDLDDFEQRLRFDRYLIRGAQKFLYANQNNQPSRSTMHKKRPRSFAP